MKRTAAAIAAFFALAAAGCADRSVAAPAPPASTIEMETFSWGQPVSSWRIASDGNGSYTYSRRVTGGGFRDYDLVTHLFSAGRDGFARVEQLLAGAARGYQCEMQVTDGPYGRIVWSRAAQPALQRSFNLGCLSPEARLVQGQMAEAGELVRGWALASPVAETREVREPRR
jgi:hypothetical protein